MNHPAPIVELSDEELFRRVLNHATTIGQATLSEYGRRYRESPEFKVMVDNQCAFWMVDNPEEVGHKLSAILDRMNIQFNASFPTGEELFEKLKQIKDKPVTVIDSIRT